MSQVASKTKLALLTAYDFNTARALEEVGIDYILVGDSLAMVALGYSDTTQVKLEEMLMCTAAVKRGAPNSTVIADLPYCAVADQDLETSLSACRQFVEAGAEVIKIENAREFSLSLIKALRSEGIRVMGHIGYTPQDLEMFKGSKLVKDSERLMSDARLLDEAGVETMVIEMVPAEIAKAVTAAVTADTIGIGSGPDTDGQVLVTDDLLGRYNLINPKFLRRQAHQYDDALTALKTYITEVRDQSFPSSEESF